MKASLSFLLACLLLAPSSGWAVAQEPPRSPQVEIRTDGRITHIETSADGWRGVINQVLALRQIPRDQDASVVASISGKLDSLPPPYAIEVVRRICTTEPEKAYDLLIRTSLRIRYDAYRCVDETAKAGIQATMMSLPLPECKAMLANAELAFRSLVRVKGSNEPFTSKASAWWVCSHGMRAIVAGMEKKTLAASDWLRPETEWSAAQKKIADEIDTSIAKRSKK